MEVVAVGTFFAGLIYSFVMCTYRYSELALLQSFSLFLE